MSDPQFDPPLDAGISEAVLTLIANRVKTFESCQGGKGHAYPEPMIRFRGGASEGFRAMSVALEAGLPATELRRVWTGSDCPWWEITFATAIDVRPSRWHYWYWYWFALGLALGVAMGACHLALAAWRCAS